MNKDILAYISAVLELIGIGLFFFSAVPGTGAILFIVGLVILFVYLFTNRKERADIDDTMKVYEMIKNIKKRLK